MGDTHRAGSLWSTAAVIYGALALLVLGKLLTNGLPPAGVGQVALSLLLAEGLGMAAGLGLPAALPKLLAGTSPQRLFRFQGLVALGLALLAVPGLYLRAHGPDRFAQALPESPWLALVLPGLIFVVALREFLVACAAGRHAYRLRALSLVVVPTLTAAQFAVFFAGGLAVPVYFVAAHGVSGVLGVLLLRPVLRAQATALPELSVGRAVGFAWPLYVNNWMNFLYQRVDTLLVVAWLDLPAAAVLEMSKRLPALVSRLMRGALVPFLPHLAGQLRAGERTQAQSLVARAGIRTAVVGYGLTLAIVALGEPLLALLFTRDYTRGAHVMGLLLIATCLSVQAGILGQTLIALERPKTVMYINVGFAVLSLGSNGVLLPRFGLAGVGWSAIIAVLFSWGMQRWAVARAGIPLRVGRSAAVHGLFVVLVAGLLAFDGGMAPRLLVALTFVPVCGVLGVFRDTGEDDI